MALQIGTSTKDFIEARTVVGFDANLLRIREYYFVSGRLMGKSKSIAFPLSQFLERL